MRSKVSPFALALALLVLATGISAGRGLALLRVSFIDVGQGDSTLIQSNGFDVLVDGGHFPAGPTVVAYLKSAGVDSLEVMVATHGDTDHLGGLVRVLEDESISVGQLLYNGYPDDINAFTQMIELADARGIPIAVAQFPAEYNWGGVTAHVLNPLPGVSDEDNELSIVLLLDQGDVEYLLTGDIGTATEAKIVARKTPVAADVLRVAHHGSRYSTSASFLAAVQPSEAIISVGANNSYGHPTNDVLERLAAAGARIWRTDEQGTIVVNSDGVQLAVNEALSGDAILVFLPVVVGVSQAAATATPTATRTVAPESTITATATETPTPTPTATGSPPPGATVTATSTSTATPTVTATGSPPPTATATATLAPGSATPTATSTATPTATSTGTNPGPTPSHTPTATATATASTTATETAVPTATPTATTVTLDLRIVELDGTSTPEYVTIQNFGSGAQDMTGWKLVSVVGSQTFDFPAGYALGPGASVRIESYTGSSHNPPAVLHWGNAAIWLNSGDKAWLQNSAGVTVSCAAYGDESCP